MEQRIWLRQKGWWNKKFDINDYKLFKDQVSIELDDDMIKLLSNHDYSYFGAFMKNLDYIGSFIIQMIDDIQWNPDKFSFKDFDTINRLVESWKFSYDWYLHKSDYAMAKFQRFCPILVHEFRYEEEYIEKYMNLPIVNFSNFSV